MQQNFFKFDDPQNVTIVVLNFALNVMEDPDKRVRYYDIGGWSWETHNFCKSEECQDESESLFTSSHWDYDEYPESQEIF